MAEINIKVRLGTETLYNTKIRIGIEQSVISLKNKMCLMDDTLTIKRLIAVYCGCVMEDISPLSMYNISDGDTVHVFKEIKPEKIVVPRFLITPDIDKLLETFRLFSGNSTFRAALIRHGKNEVINNIILTTPGLNEDPVALTLLRHSELLVKLNEFDTVKRLADNHPSLASAAIKIASAVHEELMQNHFNADMARSVINNGSDEDIEDIEDSSPASEASSRPVSRNLSFTAITAAQLASAIASVTTQQPQPSTSGASTSTANTGNILEPINAVLGQQSEQQGEFDVPTQLQMMRDMGLVNDALNLEALQLSGDLRTAVELVLNGFNITDLGRDNN